jgi:phage shock protein E
MKKKSLPIFAIVITVAAVALFIFGLLRSDFAPTITTGGKLTAGEYLSQYTEAGTEHLLIDVRTPEEFAEGHIAGAVNISLQTLTERLNEVPRTLPVILYCRSGNRSNQAQQLLEQAGYTNVQDMGGIIDWQAQGYPITNN